jgi:hypothetical protein
VAGLEGYQRGRYYHRAGVGTAATDMVREHLGLPSSYRIRQRRPITGLDPQTINVVERRQDW